MATHDKTVLVERIGAELIVLLLHLQVGDRAIQYRAQGRPRNARLQGIKVERLGHYHRFHWNGYCGVLLHIEPHRGDSHAGDRANLVAKHVACRVDFLFHRVDGVPELLNVLSHILLPHGLVVHAGEIVVVRDYNLLALECLTAVHLVASQLVGHSGSCGKVFIPVAMLKIENEVSLLAVHGEAARVGHDNAREH